MMGDGLSIQEKYQKLATEFAKVTKHQMKYFM